MDQYSSSVHAQFIALHLSVPKAPPWLILDDPVQSMDYVHIVASIVDEYGNLAAPLPCLSHERGQYEHSRHQPPPLFMSAFRPAPPASRWRLR